MISRASRILTSAGTNALKDRRQSDEALDICVWKAVGAGLDWLLASSDQSLLEGLDMGLLVVRNVAEVIVVVRAVACHRLSAETLQ